MSSVNNNIPFVPENTIDPAAGLNESINVIDALLQLRVVSVGTNTPPGSPTNGARYIVGTSPTGAWEGQANKLARWLDSTWSFFDAFIAVNQADGAVWVRQTTTWAALAGGGGGVTSVALSAPTGFSVSGSPVTTSGTFTLAFAAGYSLPTTAAQGNWNTAFGWGNHATAGYEYELVAGTGIAIDRTNPHAPVISATGGGGGMTNPMTTLGDIIVGGASGTPTRLAIGAEGQVAVVRSGVLAYEDQAGGTVPFAPVITESTTSRTLSVSDAGDYVRFTNSGASTCTVAPQASETWAANTEIHIRVAPGGGNLTLTPGSGVTLNTPSGGTLVMSAGMSVTLKRAAEDEWDVIGQTVAA